MRATSLESGSSAHSAGDVVPVTDTCGFHAYQDPTFLVVLQTSGLLLVARGDRTDDWDGKDTTIESALFVTRRTTLLEPAMTVTA